MSKQEKCKCARDYAILDKAFELTEGAIKRAQSGASYMPEHLIRWPDLLAKDIKKLGITCGVDIGRIPRWLDEMEYHLKEDKFDLARRDLESIKLEVDTKLLKCSLGE